MEDIKMEVLVFKTDVVGKTNSENLGQILKKDHRIRNWNIDHNDVDNVLRIESSEMSPADVIELVKNLGYMCEELPE
ncbi:MAG TPA: hypothetical protein VK589_07485 [Chryseolinea sp.]|nr:hypothetical protein [Chryseolinea sp.]